MNTLVQYRSAPVGLLRPRALKNLRVIALLASLALVAIAVNAAIIAAAGI